MIDRIVTKTCLSQLKADTEASGQPRDLAYWLSRPVSERLEAVELLRQAQIDTLPHAEQRFQRVCRVIQRQRG